MKQTALNIQGVSIPRGTRKLVNLKVTKLINGSMLEIPLCVVNGAKEGPELVLTPHVWPVWEWTRRVVVETKPKDLAGAIICINFDAPLSLGFGLADYPSFVGENSRGRRWPGDANGTLNEKIAYVITEEVFKRADCLLELHAGPSVYSPLCMEIDVRQGGKLRKRIEELAEVYGLKVILAHVMMEETSNVIARELGIPALIAEYWWPGWDENIISTHVTGIRNIMTFLGMTKGKIMDQTKKKAYIKETAKWFPVTRAKAGGYFYPEVGREILGAVVRKGQLLGRTLSPSSYDEIEHVKAPWDGVCFVARHHGPIHPGDSAYWVGKMEKVTWLKTSKKI